MLKTLEIQGFHDLAIFADFSENRHFFSARTEIGIGHLLTENIS
jgi:hypothetical protein